MYNPVETAMFRICTRARSGASVNVAPLGPARRSETGRGMPNGIANPIQETSGTNGGSMFYRYCSRRSTDVRLESASTYIARAFCRLQEDLWISVCLSSPLLSFSPSTQLDAFSVRTIPAEKSEALKSEIPEKAETRNSMPSSASSCR